MICQLLPVPRLPSLLLIQPVEVLFSAHLIFDTRIDAMINALASQPYVRNWPWLFGLARRSHGRWWRGSAPKTPEHIRKALGCAGVQPRGWGPRQRWPFGVVLGRPRRTRRVVSEARLACVL